MQILNNIIQNKINDLTSILDKIDISNYKNHNSYMEIIDLIRKKQ